MLIGATASYIYVTVLFCILGIFIGFCVFSVAITNDLEKNLHLTKRKIELNIDRTKKLSAEIEIEVKRNLCEIIRFHSDAKQLSEDINTITVYSSK